MKYNIFEKLTVAQLVKKFLGFYYRIHNTLVLVPHLSQIIPVDDLPFRFS
jgi:hypothetical protein